MKVWLALVSCPSMVTYVLDIDPNELQSWRAWAEQRGQRIVGEFPSQRQARKALAQWLERPRVCES